MRKKPKKMTLNSTTDCKLCWWQWTIPTCTFFNFRFQILKLTLMRVLSLSLCSSPLNSFFVVLISNNPMERNIILKIYLQCLFHQCWLLSIIMVFFFHIEKMMRQRFGQNEEVCKRFVNQIYVCKNMHTVKF